MKKAILITLLIMALALSGCGGKSTEQSSKTPSTPDFIQVNGKAVSVEEINSGIKAVFCNNLYYYPEGHLKPFFNTAVEYELFFLENSNELSKIYMVVTNMEHPKSKENSPRLYMFGISITEKGLQSDFYAQGDISPQDTSFLERMTCLGHHTMKISEILPPTYETVSEEWKQRAERAIRLYMDNNDFYSENGRNLPAGKYNVYIKGFSESDVDSTIVFEHEDGSVRTGQYYFIHSIPAETPADLNHVALETIDTAYLDKLKENAAFHMEYIVKEKDAPKVTALLPDVYHTIITDLINAYPWENDDGAVVFDHPELSYLYCRSENLSDIGFASIDLDNNGVDELIIADINSPIIYDLYTISDGKSVHLAASIERGSFTVYENGCLKNDWSGSAVTSGHDFYRLENGTLNLEKRITLDVYHAIDLGLVEEGTQDSDKCFFISESDQPEDYRHVTADEAMQTIDKYQNENPPLAVEYCLLSEYGK